ncbi:MAG: hypothetical protein ACR2OJ_07890, partial [Hyphomicrobiales bacterium]
GRELSAPAFVSFYLPPNQKRTYSKNGRIAEIHYDPPELQDIVADPLTTFRRAWHDKYNYTDSGELKGWTRTSDDTSHKFTRHGARVLEEDATGRPLRGEAINYTLKTVKMGLPEVVQVPFGRFVKYTYSGPDDPLGEVKLCTDKTCSN